MYKNLLIPKKNAIFLKSSRFFFDSLRFSAFSLRTFMPAISNMLKKERQTYILQQVNLHNKVLSSSLSQEINVSEDTIRRDLQELSSQGKLLKVHGGALSHSFGNIQILRNGVYSQDEKKVIARKAIPLIKDGMFVLTGGGTTIVEMARLLPRDLKATFVSGSVAAVLEYMEHPNIEVILIGDRVSKSSKITIGSEAISKVKQVKADLCFLGTNAIALEHGVSDNDWEVVQLKKAMIESSQKVVALSISEKIDTRQPIHICPLDSIDCLVTELDPGDERLNAYKKSGIQLI